MNQQNFEGFNTDEETYKDDETSSKSNDDEDNIKDDDKKKKKVRDPTKRRNIRKLMSIKDLNPDTIQAVKEEEFRLKQLQNQAKSARNLQTAKPEVTSSELTASSLKEESSLISAPRLTSLLTATEPINKSTNDSSVICISSDDEEVTNRVANDNETINISSDESSDDVIECSSVNRDLYDDDMNNSGLHVDDDKNQPDEFGRVLININHPPEDEDLFLSSQIAKIIRPHQIGGIRFMYDNIILTRQDFLKSDGLGCILAHSMGLGKTLQVIGFTEIFLHHTSAKTVLCVVPVNTLMNWVSEFEKWLPVTTTTGSDVIPRKFPVHVLRDIHKTIDARAKVVSEWHRGGGVLLLGYEMFRLLTTSRSQKPRKSRKKPKKSSTGIGPPIDVDEEDRKANLHKSIISMLLNPGPDLIICDEGHRIKNNGARTSERLKEVRTKRRVVLTGYPMQNNLVEYWCMVDFVRPDYLGSKREFYNLFERPITNGQGSDSTKEDRRLMRCRSDVLHNLLKGFVQRRSHSVLCHTLPEKKEYVLMIRFSKIQKSLYNSYMRTRSSAPSGEEATSSWTSCINPIRAFSVCCRIWNHPDVLYKTYQEQNDHQSDLDIELDFTLLDSNGKMKAVCRDKKTKKRKLINGYASDEEVGTSPRSTSSDDKEKGENYEWISNLFDEYKMGDLNLSGKMVILLHLIEKSISIGDKILVFSQSLSTLSLIETFLSKREVPSPNNTTNRKWSKGHSYLRLDGNTGSSEREKLINQFNSPDNQTTWLFLLSTKAGCLGINLIGANRVVVLDASWNPCYDAQAVCRCYRYGQQKKSFIYRLVADQSMEKKIYERQVSKQGMSDRVVDKLNPTQVFTKREVVSLLEFSDHELPQVDFSDCDQTDDPVLASLCQKHGDWLTKKPFTHESLLLDCKDQRLTKAERREALKNYEQDKRASLTLNYTRPSYINYYSSHHRNNSTNSITLPNNRPDYGDSRKLARPVASVQPYKTSSSSSSSRVMTSSNKPVFPPNLETDQRGQIVPAPGVAFHTVVATTDIPIPTANTFTVSSGNGQTTPSSSTRDRIRAGEEIIIMTTKKGTYIRTCENRVFTVKMNDNSPSIWSPNISNYNNGNKIRSSIPYRTSQPTYGGTSDKSSDVYQQNNYFNQISNIEPTWSTNTTTTAICRTNTQPIQRPPNFTYKNQYNTPTPVFEPSSSGSDYNNQMMQPNLQSINNFPNLQQPNLQTQNGKQINKQSENLYYQQQTYKNTTTTTNNNTGVFSGKNNSLSPNKELYLQQLCQQQQMIYDSINKTSNQDI